MVLPTPCALKASFQIFRVSMQTHIQNTSVLSVFDWVRGTKQTGHRMVSCFVLVS
jgi:hypothetical protein